MATRRAAILSGLAALAVAGSALSQTLYKYRGESGEWIYTDRKPVELDEVEVRELEPAGRGGSLTLERTTANGRQTLLAKNTLHAPVQLRLLPPGSENPEDRRARDWIIAPRTSVELQSYEVGTPAAEASRRQRYLWMLGDPDAEHRPSRPYRVPFPAAVTHRVSQAWPDLRTHTTADSAHAVDIAMPVGSDVLAAREGIVVEVSASNFKSTDTPGDETARANLVRILHDDGTFAIYAHLNWNTIRVRPGDRVERGEYIADSGNTGFSTGPHLHFVVMRNVGMRLHSLPVSFVGRDGAVVVPKAGEELTAY